MGNATGTRYQGKMLAMTDARSMSRQLEQPAPSPASTRKLVQIAVNARQPCGYSCHPDGQITTPEGAITDICGIIERPEESGIVWLEREEDRSISVHTSSPNVRWAYHLKKSDGESAIIGDMKIWIIWTSLMQAP